MVIKLQHYIRNNTAAVDVSINQRQFNWLKLDKSLNSFQIDWLYFRIDTHHTNATNLRSLLFFPYLPNDFFVTKIPYHIL